MKFTIKGPFRENIYILMRRFGYHFQKEDKEKNEQFFTRPAKGFPRFHLSIRRKGENLIFNLHLDQKKPIYKEAPAHSGEYESEIVREEAERIKNHFKINLNKLKKQI